MRSLRSHLLVAAPALTDPNFHRTVVLVIQHDKDGAFGLILNRLSGRTLADLLEAMDEELVGARTAPINVGGPVAGPPMALHTNPAYSETEILPGVHFATLDNHLRQIIREPQHSFRVFIGYSGWSSGQLESELRMGGWMILEATYELLFGEPDTLWKTAAQLIGEQAIQPIRSQAQRPADPSQN